MSFANAVCPPHAWDAFSTGFMSQIKPQVEFKINLKCVEPSGSRGYSLRMETRSVQRQIKDALKEKKLTQSKLAELCKVSDNAVSKWVRTGQVSKQNIPAVCYHLGLDAGIFLPDEDGNAIDATVAIPKSSASAEDVADAIRTTVLAIAEKWGINNPMDLLDPSPEARERVEHAIATAIFKQYVAKPEVRTLGDEQDKTMLRSG